MYDPFKDKHGALGKFLKVDGEVLEFGNINPKKRHYWGGIWDSWAWHWEDIFPEKIPRTLL